jgi:hypothetical protein
MSTPAAILTPAARRGYLEPPHRRQRHLRGVIAAIAALAVSAAAGLVLGLGPATALFSHAADSTALGTITGGNFTVTMNPTYNWTLTTPANSTTGYAGETITGGPSGAAQIANAWVSDATQLTVTYTGSFTITGDNMSASVSSAGVVTGTAQASTPTSITTSLSVYDSTGASLNPNNPLGPGTYTFSVQAFIFNTTFVQAPRFGTNASDWTFTLGYPAVTLTQVRS